jgi:hypothetical protein
MNIPSEDWPDLRFRLLSYDAAQGRIAVNGLRTIYADLPPRTPLEWQDVSVLANPSEQCVAIPRGVHVTLDMDLWMYLWNWYDDGTEHGLGGNQYIWSANNSSAFFWYDGGRLFPYQRYETDFAKVRCLAPGFSRRACRGGFGFHVFPDTFYGSGQLYYIDHGTLEENSLHHPYWYICRIAEGEWAIIVSMAAHHEGGDGGWDYFGNFYWTQNSPGSDPRGDYSYAPGLTEEYYDDNWSGTNFVAMRNWTTESNPWSVTMTLDTVLLT